jgi:hypothetical protein
MVAKSFVIAMAADIARSDYAKPTLIRSRSREWLIACRWGPEGEYLSIATAGAILDTRGLAAPDAIAPIHSLFGLLVSESETEAASTFLLVRQLPFPVELAGTFFPADGYVLLQQRDTISLVCKTRYSHSCGWFDGREVRKDIPDPAPASLEAMAWHIEATRRNWIGEFISGAALHESGAALQETHAIHAVM